MEIKAMAREMLDAGMPESEILANLNELGVADPQKVLSEAKAASSKPRAASASLEKAGRDETISTPLSTSGSLFSAKTADEKDNLFGSATSGLKGSAAGGLFLAESKKEAEPDAYGTRSVSKGMQSDRDLLLDTEKKVDELVALTKSLLDLNKKILESNRDLLLRMP